MRSTILRAHLETVLSERIATPFTDVTKRVFQTVPSGIDALDSATGGLRRGAISEIFGLPSSGKTSTLLSILAAATARDEVCALVDGNDAFCPQSGTNSGIDLKRLLWVRCRNVDQTIKTADLLLQSGGFGIVAIDLSDLPPPALQSVGLATWFRFQRAIEKTPTILVIISQDGIAKTCTSLALHMFPTLAEKNHGHKQPLHWGLLFETVPVTAEIVRNRQANTSFSHVCFSLHSKFCSPGVRS